MNVPVRGLVQLCMNVSATSRTVRPRGATEPISHSRKTGSRYDPLAFEDSRLNKFGRQSIGGYRETASAANALMDNSWASAADADRTDTILLVNERPAAS
jgi:hypothetical protein